MSATHKLKGLGLLLLLGACVKAEEAAPVTRNPPPERPQVYPVSGLETVIGRTARMLETQFGRPVLDVREGEARKLQFAAPACVLDAYLYPPKAASRSSLMSTPASPTAATWTAPAARRRLPAKQVR
jgi:hypothetical protein